VTANPTGGLFIDRQTHAICSGYITSWRLCFFNPRLFNAAQELQIGLQIWRFSGDDGVQINSTTATITNPLDENFQCTTVTLSPMRVAAGDVLGVSLMEGAVLPVVGNFDMSGGEQPRLLHFTQSYLTGVVGPIPFEMILSDNVIHVTAEIVDIGELSAVAE
jgi:hypothetical protein